MKEKKTRERWWFSHLIKRNFWFVFHGLANSVSVHGMFYGKKLASEQKAKKKQFYLFIFLTETTAVCICLFCVKLIFFFVFVVQYDTSERREMQYINHLLHNSHFSLIHSNMKKKKFKSKKKFFFWQRA